MVGYGSHFWKKAPFVKLLLALIAGIILQWSLQLDSTSWWIVLLISFIILIGFFFIPFFNRYKLGFISGIATGFLFLSVGALLALHKDIRNNDVWLGNFYKEKDGICFEP